MHCIAMERGGGSGVGVGFKYCIAFEMRLFMICYPNRLGIFNKYYLTCQSSVLLYKHSCNFFNLFQIGGIRLVVNFHTGRFAANGATLFCLIC